VDYIFETDWVAGASMMVRSEVLKKVGLLDKGYFTYFDDIDFCFNAQKHGWPTWYVADQPCRPSRRTIDGGSTPRRDGCHPICWRRGGGIS
jgi:cellulose synthase/poly-beta-1,6-N-acetylglucosamine synthase-like glycosyltransferase